ncbi:MAG: FHA domain-containing protein [Acidobacteriota bacterium]
MVDFSNRYLASIEEYLIDALSNNPMLSTTDIDPKEIVFQLAEEVRTKRFSWQDNTTCVPNVVRIFLLEEKADLTEEIEMLFSTPSFTKLLTSYMEESGCHLLMPIRVEVELASKGSSRMMYCVGRCVLTLDWPLAEEAELINIVIDNIRKQILEVQERQPAIPLIGRLTALNADVYRNNFFITKEITYLGRLRVVRDSENGRFLRRNDFVFAQLDDPKAVNNSVSRQHAKIEFRDNSFYLSDQGSANCTAIERGRTGSLSAIPVTVGTGAELRDNDIILLGSARVRFNIVDRIDTAALVLQQDQDRLARKLERGTAMSTMKLPAINKADLEK